MPRCQLILEKGIERLLAHLGLEAEAQVEQRGRILSASANARGIQAALDRFFWRIKTRARVSQMGRRIEPRRFRPADPGAL